MACSKNTLAFCFFFSLLFLSSSAQTNCSDFQFDGKSYYSCSDLHNLNSFIHWNYDVASSTVDIAFRKSLNDENGRWVAWAINPTSTGMIGSQAFVALQHFDGTLEAYTSPIDTYGTTLVKGDLSFRVHNVSAQNIKGQVIIFAKFELPMNGSNIVNHVWQEGPLQDDATPESHDMSGDNLRSFGTLDFHSGKTVAITTHDNVKQNSRYKIKIAHGIINGVSWGMMMPLGVILARLRYLPLQEYPALWFNLHIYCQSIAYFLGVAGGGLGFYLGRQSSSVKQHISHRYIGGALLGLATLQVLAHRLRPSKEHKYRVYWNIYHWCTGYGTIIMGILNCFKGFQMMDVGIWKNAYIAFLASLAFVAAALEVLRCYLNANKGITTTPAGVSTNVGIEDKA
ncbi:cytochrome b561 and DOMON domain-containing protein At5g47530-like [Solanum dulcamara]|uniref:cytochrome b561 and DOMON domain-containing protein At5g47530-like n=1 Tax=Solanum dulcamara TaxID=45834 RepID=UPI002485BC0F|nr:cytochrome b561 and DOMON domain-containing protein At5g47530-like [Solanum dulcamara]XP_055803481.1 cytochrome b561 and DOMON domain-containing protein At5g47530-like [Solanum dulcamara]